MDVLNLQPDAGDVQDTTFEVEGYEEHVEEIENAYPEEDWRSPAEIEAEQEAAAEQAPEQPTQEAVTPEQPQQPEQQVEQPKEPTKFTFTPDETGQIPDEQIQAAYGEVPEGVKRALKMNLAYDDVKEERLKELFDD